VFLRVIILIDLITGDDAGDIVKIRENDQFPADLILISSSHPNGRCFVSTANLDG
jgi:magnesium-transporting ATPase (P-type)